jgi:acetyltransferase-like isoleucine patch superfamily enzyme
MNFLYTYLCKVLLFCSNTKQEYLFTKSRKYILSWGEGSYGLPTIICYDALSKLRVGKYVSFASNTSILLGANHTRGLITTYPLSKIDHSRRPDETNERGDVVIENDVWVGYGATIIGPVTIGSGAIIGAGALVISDIPAYAVAVGIPAKIVKYRFEEEYIKKLLTIEWWNWSLEKIKKEKELLYSKDIQKFTESSEFE